MSNSSSRWLARQDNDPFVKKAKSEGYRSRAVYKLLEIQEKYNIIKPGDTVIDLGAAPGSWSEITAKLVGDKGNVIALDLLPIEKIKNVDIIQGDFREESVLQELLSLVGTKTVNLVISDMAPNLTGIKTVDQAKAMYLSELVLELSKEVLNAGGDMLVKLFSGAGFDNYISLVRQHFATIVIKKPKASRKESREVYLLARNFKV